MTKDGAALVEKIRAAGVRLPERVEFHRTYAGAWQRRRGAWAWFLLDADTGAEARVGSQYPRSMLRGRIVADKGFHDWDWNINPA